MSLKVYVVAAIMLLASNVFCRHKNKMAALDRIIKYNEKEPKSSMKDLVDGDVILTKWQKRYFYGKKRFRRTLNIFGRWPQGIVPYVIDTKGFSRLSKRIIQQAMEEISYFSCVKFVPRETHRDFVQFIRGTECSSNIGRIGRKQDISIGYGCGTLDAVMHELLHALGFFHEHQRSDRDKYVNIIWDNVDNEGKSEFKLYNHLSSSFGFPYDYHSLMHYGSTSWSKNDLPTMTSKQNVKMKLGGTELTDIDILQLNHFYQCPSGDPPIEPPTTTTTTTTTKATTASLDPPKQPATTTTTKTITGSPNPPKQPTTTTTTTKTTTAARDPPKQPTTTTTTKATTASPNPPKKLATTTTTKATTTTQKTPPTEKKSTTRKPETSTIKQSPSPTTLEVDDTGSITTTTSRSVTLGTTPRTIKQTTVAELTDTETSTMKQTTTLKAPVVTTTKPLEVSNNSKRITPLEISITEPVITDKTLKFTDEPTASSRPSEPVLTTKPLEVTTQPVITTTSIEPVTVDPRPVASTTDKTPTIMLYNVTMAPMTNSETSATPTAESIPTRILQTFTVKPTKTTKTSVKITTSKLFTTTRTLQFTNQSTTVIKPATITNEPVTTAMRGEMTTNNLAITTDNLLDQQTTNAIKPITDRQSTPIKSSEKRNELSTTINTLEKKTEDPKTIEKTQEPTRKPVTSGSTAKLTETTALTTRETNVLVKIIRITAATAIHDKATSKPVKTTKTLEMTTVQPQTTTKTVKPVQQITTTIFDNTESITTPMTPRKIIVKSITVASNTREKITTLMKRVLSTTKATQRKTTSSSSLTTFIQKGFQDDTCKDKYSDCAAVYHLCFSTILSVQTYMSDSCRNTCSIRRNVLADATCEHYKAYNLCASLNYVQVNCAETCEHTLPKFKC